MAAPNSDEVSEMLASSRAPGFWEHQSDEVYYREQAHDPDSFVTQLLRLPEKTARIKSATQTGAVTRGKALFDEVSAFLSDNSDKLVRAATVDAGRSPFLAAVRAAALTGLERKYTTEVYKTPEGELTADDLYGASNMYLRFGEAELRSSVGFSPDVSRVLSDPTSATARIIQPLVDNVVRYKWQHDGAIMPGASQYSELVNYIAGHTDDVEKLGFDAVNTVVSKLRAGHMSSVTGQTPDGLALSLYKDAVTLLRQRQKAFGNDDKNNFTGKAATEAAAMVDLLDGSLKFAAGDARGVVDGYMKQDLAFAIGSLAAGSPDTEVDLRDHRTLSALSDVARHIARFRRADIDPLAILSETHPHMRGEVKAYLQAKRTGQPAPDGNVISRLANGIELGTQLFTPGWIDVPGAANGDAQNGAGTAAGMFGKTSGFASLDNATKEMFRALAPHWIMRVPKSDEATALRQSLVDPVARDDMTIALARAMAVPRSAAKLVVDYMAGNMFTDQGVQNPIGLDQAVDMLAIKRGYIPGQDYASAERNADIKALAKWYARSVGPTGKAIDRLFDQEGLNRHILDPVVGYGQRARTKDQAALLYNTVASKIRKEMVDAMEAGGSPATVLAKYKNQGTFIQLVGFIDPKKPGLVHRITELPKSEFHKSHSYIPVFDVGEGDLTKVQQPFTNWVIPGVNQILPYIEPDLWTKNPEAFREKIREMRRFYEKQINASKPAVGAPAGIGVPKR